MHGGGWQPRAITQQAYKPSQLWQRGQHFVQRHPLSTKLTASAVGFAFGDCLAQTNCFTRRPPRYQIWRTASMGAAGVLFAGPLQYIGLQWMDAHIFVAQKSSLAAKSSKFVLDNILGCALWQASLLAIDRSYRASAAKLLEQSDLRACLDTSKLK